MYSKTSKPLTRNRRRKTKVSLNEVLQQQSKEQLNYIQAKQTNKQTNKNLNINKTKSPATKQSPTSKIQKPETIAEPW
jgi:hypothetical protein